MNLKVSSELNSTTFLDDAIWQALAAEEETLAHSETTGLEHLWQEVENSVERRARLLEKTHPDFIVSGKVSNLTHFGAFVDLGGVVGLIHISELSWGHVKHPGDIVKLGQSVTALVLSVNQEEEKVALSLKRLKQDPWQNVAERYQPGQIIHGVVSSVVDHGTFVTLEEGLEGLIHVSELSQDLAVHPSCIAQIGDLLSARVLRVNPLAKQISLTPQQDGGDQVIA